MLWRVTQALIVLAFAVLGVELFRDLPRHSVTSGIIIGGLIGLVVAWWLGNTVSEIRAFGWSSPAWRWFQLAIAFAFSLGAFVLFSGLDAKGQRIMASAAFVIGLGAAFLATYAISAITDRVASYRARQLPPLHRAGHKRRELAGRIARL
jgi:hypothetical protein